MTRDWDEWRQKMLEQIRAGNAKPPFTLSGPDTHKRKARHGQASHRKAGDEYPKFDPSPCNAAKDCEICKLPCLTALGCRLWDCPYWDRDFT